MAEWITKAARLTGRRFDGVAAYAVGMLTYDAFSFIQVTFLLFILVAMGSSLVAEHTSPFVLRAGRPRA